MKYPSRSLQTIDGLPSRKLDESLEDVFFRHARLARLPKIYSEGPQYYVTTIISTEKNKVTLRGDDLCDGHHIRSGVFAPPNFAIGFRRRLMRRCTILLFVIGLALFAAGATVWRMSADLMTDEELYSSIAKFVDTDADDHSIGVFGPGLFLWLFFFTNTRRERDEAKHLPGTFRSAGR